MSLKTLLVILRPCVTTVSPPLVIGVRKLVADQPLGNLPEQLLVLDDDVVALIKSAQNIGVGL